MNRKRIITCQHSESTNLWFSLIQPNKANITGSRNVLDDQFFYYPRRWHKFQNRKTPKHKSLIFCDECRTQERERQIYLSTFFLHPNRVIFVRKKNLFSFNIMRSRSLNFWVPRNDFPNIFWRRVFQIIHLMSKHHFGNRLVFVRLVGKTCFIIQTPQSKFHTSYCWRRDCLKPSA